MRKKSVVEIFLVFIFLMLTNTSMSQNGKTALLLIDFQYFYFEGGSSELENPLPASLNAARLLSHFREKGEWVVHIKHGEGPQSEIHENVKPLTGEKIIVKHEVNSFLKTDLFEYLSENQVDSLVLCGMQTHMCLEAATRAAADLGFVCIVIADACATKDLKYGDKIINAEDVHYSTLATFRPYAKVFNTDAYLKNGE
ncbi:MAG: cysteine hydrolase [Lentimicrobium sp.]|nr:cysteine hydrolase [Lentimicrobium sp.]